MVLEVYNKPPFSKNGLLNGAEINKYAKKILKSLMLVQVKGRINCKDIIRR